MYGADPRLAPLGTKTGCRRLFAEAGVPHPLGVEDLARPRRRGRRARRGMRAERPGVREAIVKLNEGVSGAGNALVELRRPAAPRRRRPSATRAAPTARGDGARGATTSARRLPGQARRAAAASSRSGSPARSCRSPSVQLRVTAAAARSSCCRRTTSCSAGPSGQSYLGCRFPADPAYARAITRSAASDRRHARRARACWAGSRSTSSSVRDDGGTWTVVRDRAQPPQGRDDPPVPHPAVPHRRAVRRRHRPVPHPARRTRSTSWRPTTSSPSCSAG